MWLVPQKRFKWYKMARDPGITYINKKAVRISNGIFFLSAENETRTRDPNLGKVVLYQLSYFRIL